MKIVFIGAGSAFGNRLSIDVLSREPLQESTLCLCPVPNPACKPRPAAPTKRATP
jgi:alpha-galactosidase/6-phospho-beta-glucosidase family protein